ncbi:MAG: energy transducer TonB [Gammaproteobacteria bacterium]|nr:energy transducer TonB [Gammaproteobacteria bacterium]
MPKAVAKLFLTTLTAAVAVLAGCASASRPPQFIGGADLVYPASARANGIEGRVVVRYDITMAGTVANAVVVESEPPRLFDDAALNAVRSWRFRPMVDRGEVVPAPARISELVFRLGQSSYDHLPAPSRDAE